MQGWKIHTRCPCIAAQMDVDGVDGPRLLGLGPVSPDTTSLSTWDTLKSQEISSWLESELVLMTRLAEEQSHAGGKMNNTTTLVHNITAKGLNLHH
jgi:hypothetical protein